MAAARAASPALESWTWPPRYDNSYRPRDDQVHWFPVRETMDPDERDRHLLARIQTVMGYAWEKAALYRDKWRAAGLELGDIRSLADFEKVPLVRKEELRSDQAINEPYGSYLCVDPSEVAHVNGSSTTGRPTALGINSRDWNAIANADARVMWAMGIRPSDTVLIGSPPTAIDDVVMRDIGYGGEYRIVISRQATMDELIVHVEHADWDGGNSNSAIAAWCDEISAKLRSVLGVGALVVPVRRNTFERTEFKARRVVDDRDLFRYLEAER